MSKCISWTRVTHTTHFKLVHGTYMICLHCFFFTGFSYCIVCSTQMEFTKCTDISESRKEVPPKKYIIRCYSCNYTILLFGGGHSCEKKPVKEEFDIERVKSYFKLNPEQSALQCRKHFVAYYFNKPNGTKEEYQAALQSFADLSRLDKIRRSVRNEFLSGGTSWEAVVQFHEGLKEKMYDPYLVTLDGRDVFLTSKTKLQFARDLVQQTGAFNGSIFNLVHV